jgi:hypothetical protein
MFKKYLTIGLVSLAIGLSTPKSSEKSFSEIYKSKIIQILKNRAKPINDDLEEYCYNIVDSLQQKIEEKFSIKFKKVNFKVTKGSINTYGNYISTPIDSIFINKNATFLNKTIKD